MPSLVIHVKKGQPDEKEYVALILLIWAAFDILFSILSGMISKYLTYRASLIIVGLTGIFETSSSIYFYKQDSITIWWGIVSISWAMADATFNTFVVAICANAFRDKTGPLTIYNTFRCIAVFIILIILNLIFFELMIAFLILAIIVFLLAFRFTYKPIKEINEDDSLDKILEKMESNPSQVDSTL